MERLQQTQEAWSHESVLDRSTGKLRPLASGLTASSSSLNWKGVLVEHHRLDHYDSSEIMWVNHVILLVCDILKYTILSTKVKQKL